jgi:hypothetical protein
METLAGDVVESRENPEASFAGQAIETPWDSFHVTYSRAKLCGPI